VVTRRDRGDARGQAHTLEAVSAALILLASIVFALQVTAVTPLSASTSNQHIENQQGAVADGALAAAAESGALERAVLFWNATGERFYDAGTERYYVGELPPNQFGALLEESFGDSGVAVNVYLRYSTTSGTERRDRLVYQGEPSDNAAVASRLVTLYDDAVLYADADSDGVATATGTSIAGNFYAADLEPGSGVYTVVQVEVVVWRM
jgi:hypothetical protein